MEKLFKEFSPKTLAEWNDKIITDLKGKDYENLIWDSPENIKVAPVYTRESINGLKGETTHHHADWEIEQSLNKPSNKQVLASLNGGASALLICNVESKDLEPVLENVLIQHIQTSIQSAEIETSVEALLALIEKRKLDKDTIKGSLHYDPLMVALKNSSFDSNIWNEFKTVQEKTNALSSYKTLSIQGQEYHNAGATATQELAFTLAQISEYFAHNDDFKKPIRFKLA